MLLKKIGFQWETKDPGQDKKCEGNHTDPQEFKQQREHTEGPKEYSKWPPLNYRENRLKNLYRPLKGWQRVCFPTERVEKTKKVTSQQALGKNKKKSMTNRIHGRGLMMTLPKEWHGMPDFSTLEGGESETGDLEKVRANAKQLISSSMQFRKVERNGRVNRLLKSDHGKSASLCMLKTVWKGLGPSLSVNAMGKVEPFQVTSNSSSENLSIIKAGSIYPCRETVLSMGSNTCQEKQWITESLDNQTCIAQTQCIGPSKKTLKTDLSLNDSKAGGLSDWDYTGPKTVGFSNIHNNWDETAVASEHPEKMIAYQGFTSLDISERKERALLERHIRHNRMIIEECRKEVCYSRQTHPQQISLQGNATY